MKKQTNKFTFILFFWFGFILPKERRFLLLLPIHLIFEIVSRYIYIENKKTKKHKEKKFDV
jgi:hypothetical protein